MKIYRITIMKNGDILKIKKEWNYDDIALDGKSKKMDWKEFEVMIARHKRLKKNFGDITFLEDTSLPVCSKKTIEKIEEKLGNIEFLKIKLNEEELFVINVLTVIDCLDKEKSDIEYLSKGIIFQIKKYSFKKEMLQKINIFKIPEQCTSTIFVSEEFKNIIEENRITGLEFKEVWDSEK